MAKPEPLEVQQLAWVLDRAEQIVRDEHGKDAAYSFTQAWSELPKELQIPQPVLPAAPDRSEPLIEQLNKFRPGHQAGCMAGWAELGVVYEDKRCTCRTAEWDQLLSSLRAALASQQQENEELKNALARRQTLDNATDIRTASTNESHS